MKPINKYLIIFLSLFLFAACDFMDCNESDYYSTLIPQHYYKIFFLST